MSKRLNTAVRAFIRKDVALTIMGMCDRSELTLAKVEHALRDYEKSIALWQSYTASDNDGALAQFRAPKRH